jgi:hypothetical protein
MEKEQFSPEITKAKVAFEAYVTRYHDINLCKANIIERPELHTPPYYSFVALEGEGDKQKYVRGMSNSVQVFTYRDPESFAMYLKEIDFYNSDSATAIQFIEIYRFLQEPDTNPYREASWPILYQQQIETAPVSHLAESIALPVIERSEDSKLVKVWFQSEPGERYELWTFTIKSDNSFTLDRRPSKYQ